MYNNEDMRIIICPSATAANDPTWYISMILSQLPPECL